MASLTLDSITEIEQRALVAKNGDLSAFSKVVHDWDTEPYQDAWGEALSSEHKLLIICPPDTFKSSTIQCWIESMIGENPEIRILWLMNAGAQASMRIGSVAETIETNEVYKAAFPSIVPDYKKGWNKTALYVRRNRTSPDPTLMGCGFNGPYQGLHFDIIIIDDPTNQEDVKSPTVMDMQRLKLRGVIPDRLVENGRMVAIMTRWGESDLFQTFKEIGFRIVNMPVMGSYPWGPTISNKRFPVERCEALRLEKTDAIFDLTYMCNPRAMEGGIIRREHIRYWTRDTLPKNAVLALMALDPAASTKNWADPTAYAIGLIEPSTRNLYVTDVVSFKGDIYELERIIVQRARGISNLVALGVETVGFQLTLLQRLRREYNLPVRELPYRSNKTNQFKVHGLDRDKTGRAIYIESKFMNGKLFLPAGPSGNSTDTNACPLYEGVSLESELCSFPFGAHDDRMDVIAFLCSLADAYAIPRRRVRVLAR